MKPPPGPAAPPALDAEPITERFFVGAPEPTTPRSRARAAEPGRSTRRRRIETAGALVVVAVAAILVRTFVLQTFWIPSGSMSPTLERNDRVIVNKLAYRAHPIHRGDVVVFDKPAKAPANEPGHLIKRVIGLPGERISVQGGQVHIDGRLLTEPYTHGLASNTQVCGGPSVAGVDTVAGLRIPAHHVFVMGDDRTDSADSRCLGPIDDHLVIGRAFVIVWPLGKVGGL